MATLVSPGVSVSVIDESNYAPTGPGTVPFILLATAQDKSSTAGGIASFTTAANANALKLITSQKELLNNYGLPIFPTDASGNRLFGSELAEYGLMAAHSTLGITNQAYVLRADIDLNQLIGSSSRPYSNPTGGTQWLSTTSSKWGIFQWTQSTTNPVFTNVTPIIITDPSQHTSGVPLSTVGKVGSYAIVSDISYTSANPIYQKAYDNTWNQVGSTAWQQKTPTIIGTTQPTNDLTFSGTQDVLTINTVPIAAITNGTAATFANTVNTAAIPGVTAAVLPNGYFALFVTSAAKSGGSVVDGKVTISNGTGTPLAKLGLTAVSQMGGVTFTYAPHYQVPAWKTTDSSTKRASGSVWIKTTAVNNGMNISVYRWNSATTNWDLIPAPAFHNNSNAIYNYDPTLGGLGIVTDTLFMQYDTLSNGTASSRLMQWQGYGSALTVTGTVSNPTFAQNDSFTIQTTVLGSSSLSATYTVTLTQATPTASNFVNAFNSVMAGTPVSASLSSSGNIVLTQSNGGDIILTNTSGTPLTSAGITTSTPNVYDGNNSYLVATYWQPAEYLYQQAVAPINAPATGALWYYETPLEVDIMINNGTVWKGYHGLASDARGYNLQNTDPLGPIISSSAPTLQTDGTSLVFGDIWVSTADLENYPQIYRWQRLNGVNQWVLIDNTDNTTENGILFADARWAGSDGVDPALDAKPTIVSLLTSDYVDYDAPNPQLYPRGTLLFNTRRSSYNVKKYVSDHFSTANYPLNSALTTTASWISVSGKNINNVPYMGRKAQRNVVVSALKEAVDMNVVVREDQINFNLLVCPGYPELTQNLVMLNDDRRNTGFILADTPMGLSSDATEITNYVTNVAGVSNTGEDGLVTADSYTAVFYPGAAYTNSLDGVGQVVVPITHAILRMIVKSDQNSHPWFAPAGTLRGQIDNVTKIGYVDRVTGKFISIGTNQGLRDLLYQNNVNPVAVFPNEGILNYGNHTRQATATALDRINVARLINYLRYNLERLAKPLVFEPNDTITRNEAKQAIEGLLNDIVAQRGIYDYLVVCDTTNNTPSTIDRNELHIDIAIEPTKAVEFIYIPVRILNTGAIAGSGANNGGISNTTPSVRLT